MLTGVTGANGLVGRALRQRVLAEQGIEPRFISRQQTHSPHDVLGPDLETASHEDWRPALDGVQTVIHLAAALPSSSLDDTALRRVNVDGTRVLAEAAVQAGVRRFVFVSSLGVHGATSGEQPFRYDSPIAPAGTYAATKYEAEQALKEICEATGMELVVLRPPVVCGRDTHGPLGKLEQRIASGSRLPFGRIDWNRRQVIGADNLADLLLLAATHPKAPGEPLLPAEAEAVSTHDLLARLATIHEKPLRLLPVPKSVMKAAARLPRVGGVVERLIGNVEMRDDRLSQKLNWTPQYPLDHALAEMAKRE